MVLGLSPSRILEVVVRRVNLFVWVIDSYSVSFYSPVFGIFV